jgi:hypothetical protein
VSDDILNQIDQAVDEHERCPCGRELADDGRSFYWCSEACQYAWTAHQQNPQACPHPREIRARQDQIRADGAASRAARIPVAVRVPPEPGTPMSGLGGWRPAGEVTAQVCAYRRWCPTCQAKQSWVVMDDTDDTSEPRSYSLLESRPLVQECHGCHRRWPGRPLIGEVEEYDGRPPGLPADLIRLRLRDGHRSATRLIPKFNLELWREPALILALEWEALEELLCDGVTDRHRQEYHLAHRSRTRSTWDWRGNMMPHVPILPASTIQDLIRITSFT